MRKGQKKGQYKTINLDNINGNSTLDEQVLANVEAMLLEGKRDVEIYETLEIPRRTWETWKSGNYKGFETFYVETRRKAILMLAERNILELQNSTDEKVRLDASKFATERLGKQWYSTRTESKALPVDEKLEENEKDRINDLLKDNKKEIKGEPIATYEEAVVK